MTTVEELINIELVESVGILDTRIVADVITSGGKHSVSLGDSTTKYVLLVEFSRLGFVPVGVGNRWVNQKFITKMDDESIFTKKMPGGVPKISRVGLF